MKLFWNGAYDAYAMSRAQGIHESWQPQTKLERETVLSELEAILASSHFCNSKRYPAFLKYVVENTLAGRTEQLKERTLGIEVFDRPPTFDTNSDTVVRYTAGEVRKRLLLYYSEHSDRSPLRISLPAGSYIPEFTLDHLANEHSEAAPNDEFLFATEPYPSAEDHTDIPPHATAIQASEILHTAHDSERTIQPKLSRRWIFASAAIVLFLLALAGANIWRSSKPGGAPKAMIVDRFWEPVLRDQKTAILCTGSVVFANNKYSGVETANKDIDYSFVSFQNASAIAQVSSFLAHSDMSMQMVSAPSTPLTELAGHPVVLLGGYNNQWTMRLLEPLRFHFSPPGTAEEVIVDRQNAGVRWERDRNLPYSGADDYAIIGRFQEPATGGWMVVIAGIGRNGTEAAAQFITSPHFLEQLQQQLGDHFSDSNIEAVLKVSVIDGKTGAPVLLAAHTW